jgi:hypothetical protein
MQVSVAVLVGAIVPSNAQALFKVPGTHATIQEAVEACPTTGCIITLSDLLYKLPNTLLIYQKSNLTIRGATGVKPVIQFQDKGLLAGPAFSPADAALQPAGWKQWPINATNAVGGSLNTSNPYSTSGYQQNGTILVKESSKITFENIVVDGVAPVPVGHTGIWQPGGYPTLLGNFGINVFLSKEVDVKNTKIINCFAGMYIFGRNKGGAMARNNAADLDKDNLLPNSQFGYTGQHTVEYSELANNIWGVYVESDWDLGSTFHHNLIYNNYNRDYAAWMTAAAGTSSIQAISGNSEAANHAGGFLYGKDFVTVPYKIYNNTFYQNASIFGYGMWRATTQHLFYNNLITNPYFDYNADKTALLTGNFSKYFLQQDLMSKYSDGIYNNTFAIFPEKASLNNTPSATSVVLTRSNTVFPMPRLDLQVQTQKLSWNYTSTNYTPPGATTGTYINLASPVKDSVLYWSQANLQYQANERNFPYQSWVLSSPPVPTAASIPTINYTVLGKLFGIAGQAYPTIGVKIGDTIPVLDQPNQQSWKALDSAAVKNLKATFTDTLGMVLKVSGGGTTGKDISSQTNWFIKSVPFQSLDPKNAKFLEPVWTDPGVDSVILDHGRWGIDPDGSIADVGAKAKSKGIPPSINLVDGTQAKYDSVANTIRFSFDLQELGGNFTSYQYYIFTYASSVSDDDNPTVPYNPTQLAVSSIISGTPKVGSNAFEAKLTAKPDPRSRYQVMVVAKTATGATVYSNMGTWLYKNDGFDMNVLFFDAVTKVQITTARVGQKVIMKLRPVVSRDATIRTVDAVKYFCFDSATGSLKLPTPSLDTSRKTCVGAKKSIRADTSWKDSLDPGKKTANVYTGTLQIVQIRATGLHDVANGNVTVEPTDIFRRNMQGEKDFEVVFTTAGAQIVGANGKDTIGVGGKKASFSGDGKILIRPGLPYIAQFQDPPSITLADTGFIPKEARYPVKISVFDSLGNLVDTASDIQLSMVGSVTGGMSVLGGNPTAANKTLTLHLDSANGSFLFKTQDPVGTIFWLKSKIVAWDSARVKVTPPQASLKWTYAAGDSIWRYVGQTAKINLTLLDGQGLPAVSPSALPTPVYLLPGTGLKVATVANPTVFLDTIIIDRTTASIDLLISADAPVADGILTGSNPDLQDPATFQPINFLKVPQPPTPTLKAAVFQDVNCDGLADSVLVTFDPASSVPVLKPAEVRINKIKFTVTGGDSVKLDSMALVVAPGGASVKVGLSSLSAVQRAKFATYAPSAQVELWAALVSGLGLAPDSVVSMGPALPVADGIGPRPLAATLVENPTPSTVADTLTVAFSEPVNYAKVAGSYKWPFRTFAPGMIEIPATGITVLDAKPGDAPNSWKFVLTGNTTGALAEKNILAITPASGLTDASGNDSRYASCGTDTALVVLKPVIVEVASAAILDKNGDGRADYVRLVFRRDFRKASERPDSVVVGSWAPATLLTLPVTAGDSVAPATYELKLPATFPFGATVGEGAQGAGSVDIYRGTISALNPVEHKLLADSVPPVAVGVAKIEFGTPTDKITVTYSEPMVSAFPTLDAMVLKTSTGDVALTFTNPSGDAKGKVWTFNVVNGKLDVGDSIRLPMSRSMLTAANGGVPSSLGNAPYVPVVGGDRAPDSAKVLDLNGDGTGDAVQLFYANKVPVGNPTFSFVWGGKPVTVTAADYGSTVAGKSAVTIPVAGFPAMVTSGTGTATSTSIVDGTPVAPLPFVLKDGIAAVIDSAVVTYGAADGAPDTLHIRMTEPVATLNLTAGNLVLVKQNGKVGAIQVNDPTKLSLLFTANSREFMLVCASENCKLPSYGDEVRMATGAATDLVGVTEADSSRWNKVYTGMKPVRYHADLFPNAVVTFPPTGTNPLKVVAPVSVWVRAEGDNDWTAQGTTASQWTLGALKGEDIKAGSVGIAGIKVDLNSSIDAQFLAYDNLGIFVGKADVKLDVDQLRAASLTSGSNKYSLLVGLNGLNENGSDLASGVYMFRVITYTEQVVNGAKVRLMNQNKIFKLGVYNKLKGK